MSSKKKTKFNGKVKPRSKSKTKGSSLAPPWCKKANWAQQLDKGWDQLGRYDELSYKLHITREKLEEILIQPIYDDRTNPYMYLLNIGDEHPNTLFQSC